MSDFEFEKNEYYDFVLTKDDTLDFKTIDLSSRLFYIDVTYKLCDTTGAETTTGVTLNNISLTGYDNFYIKPVNSLPNSIIDPEYTKTLADGTNFCLHAVSGYTSGLRYDIIDMDTYHKLDGGFYQGFYKLKNYPVEFLPNRFRKGWTVNTLLQLPTGSTTGSTEQVLNDIFNNDGFIFYLGTRAENKFANLTEIEANFINDNYNIELKNTNNLYTYGYYELDGEPYSGYFNYKDGLPYTGRVFNLETSELLIQKNKYGDIIDNAFGVIIKPDGRIGYRTIYANDPCYTGNTLNPDTINNNSFIDLTEDCNDYTLGRIITKYFIIEEVFTRNPIVNLTNSEPILITTIFERYIPYNDNCLLKYGDFKKGNLSIYLNGFKVLFKDNFNEIMPHELDITPELQEGVPFNISFGGGTQGLFESIKIDPDKNLPNTIETFFAGTFMGGVISIEMFNKPMYLNELKSHIAKNYPHYNLFIPRGGRRVFLRSLEPIVYVDRFSIYATVNNIYTLDKVEFTQIKPGDIEQLTLVGELGGYKQTFDIPKTYNLLAIQYYNYLTNEYEEDDKISDFTITNVSRGTVNYRRYTHNKSNRGRIDLKLIF